MTTLDLDQLAQVTGGAGHPVAPEAGQFWSGRTETPEVDDNGVGFARHVRTGPFDTGRR
jgi:hypothetical protein